MPVWAADSSESEPESAFNLSYFERVSLFAITMIGSFACYALCLALFPVLSLKPKKFALIWTLGSLLFLLAFALLNGFTKFAQHLVSPDRRFFTMGFVLSIVLTLVFSLGWKSNILVIVACVAQFIASIYYTVSYAPFGRQGLNLGTNLARSQVESWISS